MGCLICEKEKYNLEKRDKDEKKVFRQEVCAMAVVLCKGKVLAISESVFGRKVLSLPKGHQEDGEGIVETSIRECFEETNILLNGSQLKAELSPYTYDFTAPNKKLIRKTVYPFLFILDKFGETKAKEKTMLAVSWIDIDEFLKKCSYESVKAVLREAVSKI